MKDWESTGRNLAHLSSSFEPCQSPYEQARAGLVDDERDVDQSLWPQQADNQPPRRRASSLTRRPCPAETSRRTTTQSANTPNPDLNKWFWFETTKFGVVC